MSDTSFGVSKSGRIVLPRAQVECCLHQFLRSGGAASAAASLRTDSVPRLSVPLSILDEHNTEYTFTLKTWQNIVSGVHRPTFVLENTSSFMAAHPMKPGDIMGIVVTSDNRLQMRTDMEMTEILSPSTTAGLKRKNSNYASQETTVTTTTANIAAVPTATAVHRRGAASISLKRDNSAMDPSTPAPSSPEHIPTLSAGAINASMNASRNASTTTTEMVTHTSEDLAAATALMFMSSDTNFSFKGNEDATSSGISGSSPFVKSAPLVEESALSMQSQRHHINNHTAAAGITASTPYTNSSAKMSKVPSNAATKNKQKRQRRSSTLPPPPLPAPSSIGATAVLTKSNNLESFLQELMQQEAMLLLNQSAPAVQPQIDAGVFLNHAAMVIATAMHQQQQRAMAMEYQQQLLNALENTNARVVLQNQQHAFAIRNASPSDFRNGLNNGNDAVEALLRQLINH